MALRRDSKKVSQQLNTKTQIPRARVRLRVVLVLVLVLKLKLNPDRRMDGWTGGHDEVSVAQSNEIPM